MYIHKEGVRLRKLEQTDLPALLALKQESWWGTHSLHIGNLDDQIRWFNNMPPNQIVLIGEMDVPVGVAIYSSIDWVNRTLHASGAVFEEHRAKAAYPAFCAGLDFAFEMLNMHRVDAEVLEYHIPAQKLEIDRLGFVVEGRRRQAVYRCGRYYDSLVLGMLRDEWQANKRILGYGDTCNKNFSHERFERLMRFSQANSQA